MSPKVRPGRIYSATIDQLSAETQAGLASGLGGGPWLESKRSGNYGRQTARPHQGTETRSRLMVARETKLTCWN